jgi:glc operon protein GlcG
MSKITLDAALSAAQLILKHLREDKKEAVVVVCDDHGELIVLLKTDGAPYSSIQIATNKAYTAARERRNSLEVGNTVRDATKGYQIQYWGDPKITGFGGGVVVQANGATLGAIGVSGLPQAEDIHYANLGVEEVRRTVEGGR